MAETSTGKDNLNTEASPFAAPQISLPKGGGAIRGIGEKFGANPVNGTGSMTVPIATSPGRSSFGPQLSLSYDSGSGNGPFGFGWSLSLSAITRKTDKGLPQYRDAEESDVFILSGSEDLVPALVEEGGMWRPQSVLRTVGGVNYQVQRYRPRVEGLFALIERWTALHSGETHWRSISQDNVTTHYGKTAESRVSDPANPRRIFSWLICESYDDKGNALTYEYVPEDSVGIHMCQVHERNRTEESRSANRYLKRIKYGNLPSRLVEPNLSRMRWLFEVVLDYDDGHYEGLPADAEGRQFAQAYVDKTRAWSVRTDPFSTYRAGFEVRSYRLCQRILMFHHFPEKLGIDDYLVRSTEFTYQQSPIASFITAVTQSGYVHHPTRTHPNRYLKKSLPPLEFEYSQAHVDETLREIDAESLENLPYGLDDSQNQWVDLDGEGIAGILTEQGGGWFYKRNLSPGYREHDSGRSVVRLAPLELVATKPAGNLAASQTQLMDLAGDGQVDLVQLGAPVPGFYERTKDGEWAAFRAFTQFPTLDTRDPNLRFIDLDGDGHPDILIAEDDSFSWHASLGERGYGPAKTVSKPDDEEKGPCLVFADGTQSIYVADMSGDGLSDLVRIRNGEVSYWPNLGYGRFGAKLTMDNAPWFENPDLFDQQRIRLGDIDGSGTTDIFYLRDDGIILWRNQSGNSWSGPECLSVSPPTDNISSVTVMDLLGNGTACLVWSSPLPGDIGRQMRYVDLMGGQKPHLLLKITNNLGAETRVHYAPSTKFYVADKLAGRPWNTRLPFPVHVVERVETYDQISRNRFVTRYAYHHGFYDGIEREFRGFGRVDQWDAEEFATLSLGGKIPADIEASSHVPPVLTKMWFHTGARVGHAEYYREPGQTESHVRERLLPDTILPPDLTPEEEQEACRALRGALLRNEVYGVDGSEKAEIPFSTTEQNFSLRRLQPRDGNWPAVFFVHPRETLTSHYERSPSDPRITHTLTLDVDLYGNVLKEIAIGYGRRTVFPDSTLTSDDNAKQARLLITCAENRFTNAVQTPDAYRTPLPAESRTYELTAFKPENGARFSFDEWSRNRFALLATAVEIPNEETATDAAPQKRVIEHIRTLYRTDDLTAVLPLGLVELLAVPGGSYKLALTPGLLARIFKRENVGEADEDLLPDPASLLEGNGNDQGGYVVRDGSWWIPSGRVFLDSTVDVASPSRTAAMELSAAQMHFFLPRKIIDPFGHSTVVDYDVHDLVVSRSSDALGNTVTAAHNYRVLQPQWVTDPNRNRTQAAFDALGRVVATAVMGKEGEAFGDLLEDFDADPSVDSLKEFSADPHARVASLLGKATTRVVYDPDRYRRAGQPSFTATLARRRHFHQEGGVPSAIQIAFSYSDGFGREIQKKTQAGAGRTLQRHAPVRLGNGDLRPGDLVRDAEGRVVLAANTPRRWIGSGRTVFNNKGKPVRQYEAFFSATHLYESEREVSDIGASTVLFYDPLSRVVATLQPNDTYEKVIFDAWHQATYDVQDTVAARAGETGDPRTDPDIAGYVREYFNAQPASWQTWYAQRIGKPAGDPELDAAQKAAVHAATPTVAHFDALGRPVVVITYNRYTQHGTVVEEKNATRVDLTVEGNQRAVTDAQRRAVVRYDYDLLGRRIRQASMDAGERWMVHDVSGKPIRAWDSRGFRRRIVYDALRRPTHLYVTENGTERLIERTDYGEQQGDNGNHRTRVYQRRDAAGIVTSEAYDFKGNVLESRRELLSSYRHAIDWLQNPAANDGSFTSRTTYDALNRPVTATSPDGSVYRPTFNEANLLDRLEVNLRGAAAATPFVTHIDYNARGQREQITYGNGGETSYRYDPVTFRLIGLKTTRPPRARGTAAGLFKNETLIQDLRYTYDAVGNITRVEDAALETVFHGGQQVVPVCRYNYDALYRVIEASGREHIGQTAFRFNPPVADYRDYPFAGLAAHVNDLQAIRNYTEYYEYDLVGNFKVLRHVAGSGSWTRRYLYEDDSLIEAGEKNNWLTRTAVGSSLNHVEHYSHDAHGNMTTMPHLAVMSWDFRDELKRVDLGGGGLAYYTYTGSGQRARKVVESNNDTRREERIYLGSFEICRQYRNASMTVTLERESLHVMDDKQRIAIVETTTVEDGKCLTGPATLQRYQLGNHLGSTSAELDQEAALISYEEYHAFGTTSLQAGRSAAEVRLKRYRYTGKARDDETGFSYHGARYYAPWLCRWVSCDPTAVGDYLNSDGPPYSYVQNRPTVGIDPDGSLLWFLVAAIVVAVVATPQIANAPKPGDRTYTRSTADLALSMAENAVAIYAAPRLLAGGAALIAKQGIIKGGAAFLGYLGGGIAVATSVQKISNTIDPSGYLGRVINLGLALYLLRPQTAAPTEAPPAAPPQAPPAATTVTPPAATPVAPPAATPPVAPPAAEPPVAAPAPPAEPPSAAPPAAPPNAPVAAAPQSAPGPNAPGAGAAQSAPTAEGAGTGDVANAGGPRLVYRGGSATPDNLTPRPGTDTTGLSTFDNLEAAVKPGGKAQQIDLSKLQRPLVGVPDAPPPGHVSIRPGEATTPDVLSAIVEWAATRGTGTEHPFTKAIIEAIVGEVRRPR